MHPTPSIQPPKGPAHHCLNANCGCNDLVTAGPCTLWCSEHGVEASALETGHGRVEPCNCGHATCVEQMTARTGVLNATAERGTS